MHLATSTDDEAMNANVALVGGYFIEPRRVCVQPVCTELP